MKNWLKILIIIVLTAFVYRDSFTSRFFQDDSLLLKMAQTTPIFTPISNFPYRPVAIQLFYGSAFNIFGLNPTGYHTILFLAFCATIYFVYLIAKELLGKSDPAIITAFFYALNISTFANFYWIANSYFSLGALFFFATIYFYLRNGRLPLILFYLSFILTLGSNELAITIPILLAIISWYQNKWRNRLFVLGLLDVVLFLVRYFFVGLPQNSAYSIEVNTKVFSTFRWYILRAINLPEGIRFSSDPSILILFAIFILVFLVSLIKYFKGKKINCRLFVLSGTWFIVAALPFYFLPNHMSSYYLTMAIFGSALLLGEILKDKKTLIFITLIYFLLTARGLDFLSKTHWIILKNTGPIGSF